MATKGRSKPAAKRSAKKKAPDKLTLKQESFAENYITNGGNATQAARDAGYAGNDNVLGVTAHDNLKNPKIQRYVRKRLDGLKATSDEVINLLSDHLRTDVADFDGCFNPDGTLNLPAAKQAGVSHLVKKIKVHSYVDKQGQRHTLTSLELHDSQSAAKTLADIHGIKQQPKSNEHDIEANREMAEHTLQQLINDCNFNRDQAIAFLSQNAPDVAKWLM